MQGNLLEGVDIRPLKEIDQMEAVETIQHQLWGDAAIHAHVLLAFVRNGNPLIGAFKDGHIIGFVFGYLGTESPEAKRPAMANLKLASQRMGVLPEFRNSGIGYALKLAQRAEAQRMGIRLITWTFDPMLTRNAHLNLHKLGGIAREFKRDYYGTKPAPQVSQGISDRFIVEWWVTSNRVQQRIEGTRGALSLRQYLDAGATIINQAHAASDDFLTPNGVITSPTGQMMLVETPDNFTEMLDQQPDLARTWRLHMREIMTMAMASGFAVTDFLRGEVDGRARSYYAMTNYFESVSAFSSN
jgi:predicted GNAT superfamily acetyltransferase